jgi:hypothetical protein
MPGIKLRIYLYIIPEWQPWYGYVISVWYCTEYELMSRVAIASDQYPVCSPSVLLGGIITALKRVALRNSQLNALIPHWGIAGLH